MATPARVTSASLTLNFEFLGDTWPPDIAPTSPQTRRVWYFGASFSNVPTSYRAEGPRTSDWLTMLLAYQGNLLIPDGEPGDGLVDFEGYTEKNIARDTGNGELNELVDAVVLEFFGDAFGEAVIPGAHVAIDRAVTLLGRMATRAKRAYFVRYPPMEPALGTCLMPPYTTLNIPAWNAWRTRYEAAMVSAGYPMIEAYNVWTPTYHPLQVPAGSLDYHLTSVSAYAAARHIYNAVTADFD